MRIEVPNPEAVVKKAFWLAWQACGGPMGMGAFRDNAGATEADVWKNVCTNGDYAVNDTKPGCPYGDYVFGRMMKLGMEYDTKSITIRDTTPRSDYQAWCRKYPTYKALIDAAIAAVK